MSCPLIDFGAGQAKPEFAMWPGCTTVSLGICPPHNMRANADSSQTGIRICRRARHY